MERQALPQLARLDALAPEVAERALWWERHPREVLDGAGGEALASRGAG